MSKPWYNQPTPLANQSAVEEYSPRLKLYVDLETARDLERRMRAAENLLEWLLCECESNTPSYLNNGIDAAKKHLEAARKENEQ